MVSRPRILEPMRYWLMKSEPSEFSIHDLARDQTAVWDGVRNYQARNFMKDMRLGDRIVCYHSNAKAETGAVGLMAVTKEAYPDPTQFDATSEYLDLRATRGRPRWVAIEVGFLATFKSVITLNTLRTFPELKSSRLLMPGNRLSVLPLTDVEYHAIVVAGQGTRHISPTYHND